MMFFVTVEKPYIDYVGWKKNIRWQQAGQFILSARTSEKAAQIVLKALPELPKEVKDHLDQKKYAGKKGYELRVTAMIKHARILEVPICGEKEFFR